jgi:hypothetical protein
MERAAAQNKYMPDSMIIRYFFFHKKVNAKGVAQAAA